MKRLIVPLDGSRFGEHALPWALLLVRRTGAHLDLVHVEVRLPYRDLEVEARLGPWGETYLRNAADRVRHAGAGEVERVLLEGRLPEALLDHTSNREADLVVMSTHGRGPPSRFWLGSVSDVMLREASCPVLLVRPGEESPDLAAEPQVRRILVPVDDSEPARAGLDRAVALGRLLDADLHLLRVVAYPVVDMDVPRSVAEAEEVRARHRLEEVAVRVRKEAGGHSDVQVEVLVEPSVAEGILRRANAVGADMIVLGTRGRGGLVRAVLGSVADKVVRGSEIPVLVGRAP